MRTKFTVAFCTQASAFLSNQIFRYEIAAKYPGALWIPELALRLTQHGLDIITGDVALQRVKRGNLLPENILIIQDDQSVFADQLIALGAQAKILICGESPLFAANFYINLPKLSRSFDHCILFRGMLSKSRPFIDNHVLWFPSFDANQQREPLPWNSRRHMILVAGNKYWNIRRSFFRAIAAGLRDRILSRPRRYSKDHASLQLHDRRLSAVSYFGGRGELDLFGENWNDLNNLPPQWQIELAPIVRSLQPRPCASKHLQIARYKFAICFENMEFPGYVTEKIIDALCAGVIPLYLGAPDIGDFIPEDCYVDARKFDSLAALGLHLHTFTEVHALMMIRRGQMFLHGVGSKMFSYGSFVDRIEKLLISK